jgi:hypothetical protein
VRCTHGVRSSRLLTCAAQIADHLSMLATPAAYSIVLNAFTSADGRADLSKFNKADW